MVFCGSVVNVCKHYETILLIAEIECRSLTALNHRASSGIRLLIVKSGTSNCAIGVSLLSN
jgi:hypothetical protein